MIRKTFIAATLALTTLAAPAAMAGGTLSFEVNPTNAEEANMIRLGLGIFQIANGGDPAQVLQNGNGNGRGISASSRGDEEHQHLAAGASTAAGAFDLELDLCAEFRCDEGGGDAGEGGRAVDELGDAAATQHRQRSSSRSWRE